MQTSEMELSSFSRPPRSRRLPRPSGLMAHGLQTQPGAETKEPFFSPAPSRYASCAIGTSLSPPRRPGPSFGAGAPAELALWPAAPLLPSLGTSGFSVAWPCPGRPPQPRGASSLARRDAFLLPAAALPLLRVAQQTQPRQQGAAEPGQEPWLSPRCPWPCWTPVPGLENSIVLNRTMLHCLSIHQIQEVSYFCLFTACFWALHELFIEIYLYFFPVG